MPNPFIRLGTPVQNADASPTDRSIPAGGVTPVPERVAGQVFAYRGQETHGVPVNRGSHALDEDSFRDEHYVVVEDDEEPGPDPIPVRVVQDGGIEIKNTVISRATARALNDGPVAQIVGGDEINRTRTEVLVKNIGTVHVWVGTDVQTANEMTGWKLGANEIFTHKGHSPLYAMGSDGTTVPLCVVSTFAVQVKYGRD